MSASLTGRQPRGTQKLAGGKPWQPCCLWKRKTTPSRFLLFCLKLETGVAYLSRTEILVVERGRVATITSSTIISFVLINFIINPSVLKISFNTFATIELSTTSNFWSFPICEYLILFFPPHRPQATVLLRADPAVTALGLKCVLKAKPQQEWMVATL